MIDAQLSITVSPKFSLKNRLLILVVVEGTSNTGDDQPLIRWTYAHRDIIYEQFIDINKLKSNIKGTSNNYGNVKEDVICLQGRQRDVMVTFKVTWMGT